VSLSEGASGIAAYLDELLDGLGLSDVATIVSVGEGLVSVEMTLSRPATGFNLKTPGAEFTMKRPRITFVLKTKE
jgi:hypothetical protein